MTTVFYAPPEAFSGDVLHLPEEEARHAVRVLRHGVGDELVVVDGEGGRHRVRLVEAGKHSARAEVVATEREVGEARAPLALGLAVLKNAARFETFAEKAVELGATEIFPLETERTERIRWKADRLRGVLVAAMKQSGRCRLPLLHPPRPLAEVVREPRAGLRLLCHEAASPDASLWGRLERGGGGGVTVLVGPEGGFSEREVARAVEAGWAVTSLGPRRLRAETAAMAAAAAAMLYAARGGG